MTSQGDALAGVDLKVARAQFHRDLLAQGIRAWKRGKTHRLVTEAEDEGRTHVLRIRDIKPMPTDWPVVFGDYLFNLRSALDQLMWQLVEANNGKPSRDTAFPIFRTKDEKAFQAKVSGAHPDIIDAIWRVQPFVHHAKDLTAMKRDPLALLHLLNNRDKHRLTPIVAHLPETASYDLPDSLVGSNAVFVFQPLTEGTGPEGTPTVGPLRRQAPGSLDTVASPQGIHPSL